MNTTTAPSTTAAFPPVIELSPADAREVLRQVPASVPVELPLAQIDDRVIPGGPTGEVSIRIVRPANTTGVLPVVLHSHGGGCIPGDKDIHERLGCELANQAQAVVVFVRYTPAPEAHYPTQNEQVYTALHWAVASAAQISAGPIPSRAITRDAKSDPINAPTPPADTTMPSMNGLRWSSSIR